MVLNTVNIGSQRQIEAQEWQGVMDKTLTMMGDDHDGLPKCTALKWTTLTKSYG